MAPLNDDPQVALALQHKVTALSALIAPSARCHHISIGDISIGNIPPQLTTRQKLAFVYATPKARVRVLRRLARLG